MDDLTKLDANHQHIAGVDEAGRGPLCGPVVAAAVILNSNMPIVGIKDSKKLSSKRREQLAEKIKAHALAWSIGKASVEEIDRLNILHASLLAMKRAVIALTIKPQLVLIDGNHCPDITQPTKAIIQGDSKVEAIAAASILAKVTRDHEMIMLSEQWPQYGLAQHKGYPTKMHLDALSNYGPSPIHRKSFKPVKRLIKNTEYN